MQKCIFLHVLLLFHKMWIRNIILKTIYNIKKILIHRIPSRVNSSKSYSKNYAKKIWKRTFSISIHIKCQSGVNQQLLLAQNYRCNNIIVFLVENFLFSKFPRLFKKKLDKTLFRNCFRRCEIECQ